MKITIDIKNVTVLKTNGVDIIMITVNDNNAAYPIMNDPTIMKIDTQRGLGEEYCRTVLGIEPTVRTID